MTTQNRITVFLGASVPVAVAISAVNPPSGSVWFLEIFWCVGYWAFLAAIFPRFRFSNIAYAIAVFWCILQAVGAHYTFERVPLTQDWLGFERNHFDRIAHFAVGINAYLISEYLFRKQIVPGLRAAAAGGFFVIVAVAGLWELVEWIYAVYDGGEMGAAFLGSQGDIWDAQKDILCDTLGGLVAGALFVKLNSKALY
jgi:putative membrane protein